MWHEEKFEMSTTMGAQLTGSGHAAVYTADTNASAADVLRMTGDLSALAGDRSFPTAEVSAADLAELDSVVVVSGTGVF